MTATEAEVLQPELSPEPPKKTRAIAKRNGTQAVEVVTHQPSMEEVLMKAVEQGASIETLERIAAMIEKAQAAAAKREYFAALANFQGEMPAIKKPKNVKDKTGAIRFWYAPLDYILKEIRPYLAPVGLSITTGSRVSENGQRLIAFATLHHTGGHSETEEFEVPITLSQFMSDQQSFASASSFAERHAVRKVTGVVPEGDDDERRLTPNEAREAKARQPVSQPRQTPTAQRAEAQKANGGAKEKVQIEPAAEGEAIDASTIKGLQAAMEHAALGQAEFTARFPKLSGLEQVKKTDSRVIMSWIADPSKN